VKRLQRFESRINAAPLAKVCSCVAAACTPILTPFQRDALDLGDTSTLPSSVANSVRESARRESAGRARVVEKADRATVEQALDPRTRLVLFKMLNQGVFTVINGCISTGKEANVYHATTAAGHHLAVKVYKTSILVFKDRDRYVTGDWRFRNGYCKSNPRKMVRTWAEKEMRNLSRLREAGIYAPAPHLLRAHVLVMDFIGADGFPAPRLKDAGLPASKLRDLYTVLVQDMRTMFQVCRLVHADLSEYNILFLDGRLAIIDVSQARKPAGFAEARLFAVLV
jgi:RIO kinase 1